MLIVNADDLGSCEVATDSAMFCFARRRISSGSAMVFMKDSERAAKETCGAGLDVGLHINLSEEFSGRSVPEWLRKAHRDVRRFLTVNKYALVVFNPLLIKQFESVLTAQLDEFDRLFGRPPSHLDGHQHLHLATNVLVQRLLPTGARVRRSLSFRPGEKGPVNRWYRGAVNGILKRRYRVTDHFFLLSHNLSASKLEHVLTLARNSSVELAVHPQRAAEYDVLMSDAYANAISQVRLVGYDAL